MTRIHRPGSTASVLVLSLLAASVLPGCGSSSTASKEAGRDSSVPVVRTSAALDLAPRSGDVADVVDAVLPSVVSITSTRMAKGGAPFGFFGAPAQRQKQQGLGSGVILSADGVIVTNNHVVEGADEVVVRTHDDHEYSAKVLGTDPKSDVAVLQLQGKLNDLRPIAVGDSSQLRLGETVLAVGNPFGVGQTVTMGIVSAKGRADMGIVDYEDFIQTDAAINPGNSGGALVNLRGELVGINTAILSRSGGSQGIGFAIPTSMASPIIQQLRTDGHVTRGWLGVALQELNQDLRDAMRLEGSDGVLIADVQKGGPADKAGLRSGDVVTHVGDKPVESSGQLRNSIASSGANKPVKLTVLRDGKSRSVDVTLGELPGEEAAPASVESSSGADHEVHGLSLKALTPELRSRLRVPAELEGVVITRVQPGSKAAQAKLQPGDLVLEVNRQAVRNPAQVEKLFMSQGSQLFTVYRQGQRTFVVLK
ncbi:MAG TPA: DegQ family serine endoprotease [Polyangiaceae bacterium]|nr:DegQ family serine endoprotease [Polyangiaceae bacterium]